MGQKASAIGPCGAGSPARPRPGFGLARAPVWTACAIGAVAAIAGVFPTGEALAATHPAAARQPDKPGAKPQRRKPTDSPRSSTGSTARKAAAAAAAAGAAGAATATAMALKMADDDQRHAYSLTHIGEYHCEFKRAVQVLAHPSAEGYVHLHFDRRVVTAKPVLSSTGAIRLEDVRGQFMMLQIAFKSMLLDTRSGRRVVDDCVHENHAQARAAAAEAPPQPGLGIAPAPAPVLAPTPTAPPSTSLSGEPASLAPSIPPR